MGMPCFSAVGGAQFKPEVVFAVMQPKMMSQGWGDVWLRRLMKSLPLVQ